MKGWKRTHTASYAGSILRSIGGASITIWCVAILCATLLNAQTVQLGPTDALAFDYLDSDLQAYSVTNFQASWDGGAWGDLTTTTFRDSGTQAGATSFKFVPPFSSGNHTVSVRACNAAGCGGGSIPFAFSYGASSLGAVPFNMRKVPR